MKDIAVVVNIKMELRGLAETDRSKLEDNDDYNNDNNDVSDSSW